MIDQSSLLNTSLSVLLLDLQAQIKAIPATDLTAVNTQLAALAARVTKLETPAPSPANLPPVWTTVPQITFTQGKAGTFSILPFVSDPNNDPLTITKNITALPPGVTYAAGVFSYDGSGAAVADVVSSGNFLVADDGRP